MLLAFIHKERFVYNYQVQKQDSNLTISIWNCCELYIFIISPNIPMQKFIKQLILAATFIKCQQIKKVNDPCEVKQKALTYDG